MAAHEVEIERFIPLVHAGRVGGQCDLLVGGNQADHQVLTESPRGVRPDLIGEPARRHGDEPAFRVVGQSLCRPLHRGGKQGFLDRVFASTEVAVAPQQGAQDRRREIAQQILGAVVEPRDHASGVQSPGGPLITCRTSMARFNGLPPWPGAAEASAAIA